MTKEQSEISIILNGYIDGEYNNEIEKINSIFGSFMNIPINILVQIATKTVFRVFISSSDVRKDGDILA